MRHSFLNPQEYSKHSRLQYEFAHKLIATAEIKPTDRILDIGCGDGKITADISKLTADGQVIGTDISAEMIHFATRLHASSHRNLGFMVMNAEINVFINQFDLVTSFCCLHWVRKQLDALKGIKKALVENGRALLLVPLRHEELYSAIESVLEYSKWRQFFIGFVNPHMFFTCPEYQKLLSDAGLKMETFDEQIMQYTFRTKEEMESFLKAWLPHIKQIPPSLHRDFMSDISQRYLTENNQTNTTKITLPLRMLHVHALNPKLVKKSHTSSTDKKTQMFFSEACANNPVNNHSSHIQLRSKL